MHTFIVTLLAISKLQRCICDVKPVDIIAITTSGAKTNSNPIDTSISGNAIEVGHRIGADDINSDYWDDHLLGRDNTTSPVYRLNVETLPSDGNAQLAMQYAIMETIESICNDQALSSITSPIFLGIFI